MPLIDPEYQLPDQRAGAADGESLRTADVPIIRAVVWWLGLAQAILAGLAASTAFMGLHLAVPGTVATLMLVLAAAQAYLEKPIQRQVTSNKDVVEAAVGDEVYAGEANSLAKPGQYVRPRDSSG